MQDLEQVFVSENRWIERVNASLFKGFSDEIEGDDLVMNRYNVSVDNAVTYRPISLTIPPARRLTVQAREQQS